jgi:hypothetical protein
VSQTGQMIIESSWLIFDLYDIFSYSNFCTCNIDCLHSIKKEMVRSYVMEVISSQFFLQLVYSPHLFQHFILPIVFAFQPFLSKYLTIWNGLAKWDRVYEAVFEYSWVGTYAWDIVSVVVLAEVTKFIRNIEIIELVSD